jgi:hypothetical protein
MPGLHQASALMNSAWLKFMFCKRNLSFLAILLFFSQTTNAQFGKLINKAKEKALEKVTGKRPDTTAAGPNAVDTTSFFDGGAPASGGSKSTDGDANTSSDKATNKYTPPAPMQFPHTWVTVKAIHATMDQKNAALMEEIEKAAKEKFPFADNAASAGRASKMGNPAWGGVSALPKWTPFTTFTGRSRWSRKNTWAFRSALYRKGVGSKV